VSSLILRTATRYLTPLLLLFSLFLLWRGHHEPGGGFVGGLVAATAFVLVALAEGPAEARRSLRVAPQRLVPLGLALSAAAGCLALATGRPFLTGLWLKAGGLGVGTPLLFDLGVYVTVLGVVLAILLALMEEADPARSEEGGA
jgi:multisubunit Na+/H+ antiporter MnhB subunit